MADSQKRIAAAFLVGALLIAGAFVVSRKSSANTYAAAIVPVERNFIQVRDSNNDGIPNWQDALIKTEPVMVPNASSTYEEPTTVTGKFALRFFEEYLRSKTYGMFGDSNEELVAEATEALANQATDELFTEKDLTTFSIDGSDVLRTYGNQVALVILAHPNKGDSEGIILQEYVRYGDKERLKDLEPIALAYTTIVKKLLEVPVPETYTKEHLDLVNAINAVREDVRGMQKVEEDPLYTFIRLKRYEDDVLGLSNALSNLYSMLSQKDGVRFFEGDATLELVTLPE